MKNLSQSLRNYSPSMVRAIAEVNGIELRSNQFSQMIEQLNEQLNDADTLEASRLALSPPAQAALAALLAQGGRSLRSTFERSYGVIRATGPGRLERERPHLAPDNPSEELWYRGLLHAAIAETPNGLVEFLYIPADLAARLPQPAIPAAPFPPAALAGSPQAVAANEATLHDACSLLCLIQAGLGMLRDPADILSWQSKSLYELNRLSLQPQTDPAALGDGPGSPAALALTLAHDLGWLRARGRRLLLAAPPVRAWLEAGRATQRRVLLEAWQRSTTWNDLCRTPSLSCEQTGSWANDPAATRAQLHPLLARLAPDAWYALDDLVAAVRAVAPDFQRPDGNYDTWYLRRRGAVEFLRGFEHWEAVEGEVLRFLLRGPLSWLGAVDGDAEATAVRLTAVGHVWLTDTEAHTDTAITESTLVVQPDFVVLATTATPLLDRFRLARFTTWLEPQGTTFGYRISQSGMQRAAQQGITVARILEFLHSRAAAPLPVNVVAALERRQG
ncbi:MAG: hypothetical protein WAZ19_13650 [Anaerolineae bacterium]